MDLWNETAWYVPVLFNVLLIVLSALAGLAVASEFGAQTIKSVRKLYQTMRPAIDEETDPIILLIAARLKLPPKTVRDFILGNLDKVIAVLPQEAIPQPEQPAPEPPPA